MSKYALVTPVKDEEATIKETLRSVSCQSVIPVQWVIVSDGSQDRTDEYVKEAREEFPWIQLVQLPVREGRDFAAVVKATEVGVSYLNTEYDFIGLLDADVRFDSDYFEKLIGRFEGNQKLGLAGGVVVDVGTSKSIPRNRRDVPGAVQMFRKDCFESLDGLLAIPEGGWDALTCAKARMEGYETELVTELMVDHLKPRNVHVGHPMLRHWDFGVRDCALGYHPLFELVKCASRARDTPFLVSSIVRWFGFVVACFRSKAERIPYDLRQFIRKEQVQRLRSEVELPILRMFS